MRLLRVATSAVLLAALVGAFARADTAIRPTSAEHVPGGYYSGSTALSGGVVELAVSSSGASIVHLRLSATLAATTGICGLITTVQTPGHGIAIRDHGFTFFGTNSGVTAAGSFSRTGAASGTLTAPAGAPGCPAGVNTTWTATSTPLLITPNSPYVSGVNSIVVEGSAPVQAASGRIVDESRREVLVIWLFRDNLWRYFLPATLGIEGGVTFPGPVASAFAVLQ